MKNLPAISNQVFYSAYIVVCAVILLAVLARFEGLIQVTIGVQGIQVTVDGRQNH